MNLGRSRMSKKKQGLKPTGRNSEPTGRICDEKRELLEEAIRLNASDADFHDASERVGTRREWPVGRNGQPVDLF
jgi:hypothetical protein